MRLFITKALLYTVYTFLLILILWLFVTGKRAETLRTDANIIICGNSKIEYGINDNLIPHSLNIGLNAEHLEYIYAKIKLLKKYNPQIDTLIIGIDNVILFKDYNKEHPSTIHHPYYYDQYSFNDILFLIKNASLSWNESYISRPFSPIKILAPCRAYFNDSISIRDLGIGGYYLLPGVIDTNKIDIKLNQPTEVKYTLDQIEKKLSTIQIYFLRKIIEFCQAQKITVIFITTPVFADDNDTRYKYIIYNYFPDIQNYDYRKVVFPDSCYCDIIHLNTQGAILFSNMINRDLSAN